MQNHRNSKKPVPKRYFMAVISLVWSILSFMVCLPLPIAYMLSKNALNMIKKEPEIYSGHGVARAGVIVSTAGMILWPVFAILIMIPSIIGLGPKANDALAKSAGINAKLAEEVYFSEREQTQEGTYTSDLNKLLLVDKNLVDDPAVTFIFNHASPDGFTLTTSHAKGSGREFTFSD